MASSKLILDSTQEALSQLMEDPMVLFQLVEVQTALFKPTQDSTQEGTFQLMEARMGLSLLVVGSIQVGMFQQVEAQTDLFRLAVDLTQVDLSHSQHMFNLNKHSFNQLILHNLARL